MTVAESDILHDLAGSFRGLKRSEYDALVELGVFEDEKIELIEGVLVEMSPEKARHAWVIQQLNRLLVRGLPDDLALRVTAPWAASERSEPEPDLAVVPAARYVADHPTAAVLLLEVSNSSLRKDLGTKARVYASAGVPEYWVIDLVHDEVVRHTDPRAEGYSTITRHGGSETLDACGVAIDLGSLLARE